MHHINQSPIDFLPETLMELKSILLTEPFSEEHMQYLVRFVLEFHGFYARCTQL